MVCSALFICYNRVVYWVNEADLKIKKIFPVVFLVGVLVLGVVALSNLDILLRAFHHYQEGTLSEVRFRLDLASYNIGRAVPPIPADAIVSSLDGMTQVFIPEGEFMMGNGVGGDSPKHLVYLDSFWMDRTEVTNAMYQKCMSDGVCTAPASVNIYYDKWVYRNHPIVYVTWYQAQDYCEWAGRRLPTEAEWEKAARGTDERPYPWGDDKPNPRLANFDRAMIDEAIPVFRYPLGASPYGVLNMSGNVREWVADWFDKKYYYVSPYANPQGPETGEARSLRSGAYSEDSAEIAVYRRYRHAPDSPGLNRGFRCAQDS